MNCLTNLLDREAVLFHPAAWFRLLRIGTARPEVPARPRPASASTDATRPPREQPSAAGEESLVRIAPDHVSDPVAERLLVRMIQDAYSRTFA